MADSLQSERVSAYGALKERNQAIRNMADSLQSDCERMSPDSADESLLLLPPDQMTRSARVGHRCLLLLLATAVAGILATLMPVNRTTQGFAANAVTQEFSDIIGPKAGSEELYSEASGTCVRGGSQDPSQDQDGIPGSCRRDEQKESCEARCNNNPICGAYSFSKRSCCLLRPGAVGNGLDEGNTTCYTKQQGELPDYPVEQQQLPGVNVGGWLVLEDWFFSADRGTEVATPSSQTEGQGRCLPPLLKNTEPWPSEGVLTYRLLKSRGRSATAEIFEAHRRTYIQEDDLKDMAHLNIKTVRLPLTWAAFADALSDIDKRVYGSHNPETDTAIVPDPFYHDECAFATIPRSLIANFVSQAQRYGLKVILDLHAFPGGSSHGTFNGVWPRKPMFWKNHSQVGKAVPLKTAGKQIARAMIKWVASLPVAIQRGIKGLTLMNEPAHMNANAKIADESDVFTWLADAAQDFRESTLPKLGIRLYVNLIASAFKNISDISSWYLKTFSKYERKTWAVLDIHYYMAWNEICEGRTIPDGDSYGCNFPYDFIMERLRHCLEGAHDLGIRIESDDLRAITEFSAGTFFKGALACKDKAFLKAFLKQQVQDFNAKKLETFFWTWRMPYGSVFEPGWSLKWLSGLEDKAKAHSCL